MNLINIIDKIPGPFDIILNNLSLIHINYIIKICKLTYNIKTHIIKNNFFYTEYKKINNIDIYYHLCNNNLNIFLSNNYNDNKKLNMILYKHKAISLEFYPKNFNKLTDYLINENIEFIYNSKINDINGFKHFKYTNTMKYIEYVIENKFSYVINNIFSQIFNKTFRHIDIIFNKVFIIVYYSYLLLYHIFYKNFKSIKYFYLSFYKKLDKIKFNITYEIAIYILKSFKTKIDNICELLRSKIGCDLLLFYKINLLYIYMIIEKKFTTNYNFHYNDIANNKKLLIEKINILKIPKYLKHIFITKISII
tara:strand:- start:893 stop:1816 length:924 start_codon:yes stop_codon:yes gene_type:complete